MNYVVYVNSPTGVLEIVVKAENGDGEFSYNGFVVRVGEAEFIKEHLLAIMPQEVLLKRGTLGVPKG